MDWRYGMFIHYGLYSILGRGEWVLCKERIPQEEYSKLTASFSPKAGICREWARLAKQSGMKYLCFTTVSTWAPEPSLEHLNWATAV